MFRHTVASSDEFIFATGGSENHQTNWINFDIVKWINKVLKIMMDGRGMTQNQVAYSDDISFESVHANPPKISYEKTGCKLGAAFADL